MRYAILCTYPSGQQRLVSTFLEDDKDNISDEYMECLQGCNPHNFYEIVGVSLSFLKEANEIPVKDYTGSDVSRVCESVHHA